MSRIEQYVNGVLVSTVDNRTVSGEKANKVSFGKKLAEDEILLAYPEFKQRNLAMGIITGQEATDIKAGIQAVLDKTSQYEVAVNGCTTLDELDSVNW